MKRQTNQPETQTRVYSYGTVPPRVAPVLGATLAEHQIKIANRLWNTLVAIDRTRSERYKLIMEDAAQVRIKAIGEEIEVLREEIKAKRKQARKRAVDLGDTPERLNTLKVERHTLIEAQKASKEARHAAKQIELTELSDRTKHRIKRARQAASRMGLYWGTYNDIVQRADSGRKLGELQFRSYREGIKDDGTLTAQIIGGAAVGSCIDGTHTFFQVEPVQPGRKWRYARMRIGSDDKLRPVWLQIPIVLHRPIPSTSLIKSVSMTRRKGVWQLNATVTMPTAPQRATGPAIAVDIGWRLLPEGVRVGYWATESNHGQVLVTTSDISQLEKVSELRSTCDKLRDEFLPALAAWVDEKADILNVAWQEQTKALIQWRSSDRIARLIRWWADNRLPDDGEAFEMATVWRKQYLHLSDWWRNLDDQMRGRIREQYRIFASKVAKEYSTIYIEDFDLREVIETPNPEAPAATASGKYRQMVSPSLFRAALVNACKREGLNVIKLPSEFTTRHCHVCGHTGEWDQIESVMHRCDACNTVWDQDHNAAVNLYKMGASGAFDTVPNPPVIPSLSQTGAQVHENEEVMV